MADGPGGPGIVGLDEALAEAQTEKPQADAPADQPIYGLEEFVPGAKAPEPEVPLAPLAPVIGRSQGTVTTTPSTPEEVIRQQAAEEDPSVVKEMSPAAQQWLNRSPDAPGGLAPTEWAKIRYDSAYEKDQAAAVAAWTVGQTKITPEQARDVAQVAAVHRGLSPQYIADHLDELKASISQDELRLALANSPRLQSFVLAPEAALHTARVQAQLPKLSWFERWITGRSPGSSRRRFAPAAYPGVEVGSEEERKAWAEEDAAGLVPMKPLPLEALSKGLSDQYLNNLGRSLKQRVESGQEVTGEEEYRLAYALANAPGVDVSKESTATRAVYGAFEMAPSLALSVGADTGSMAVAKALVGGAAGPWGKLLLKAAPIVSQVLLQKQQTDGTLFMQMRALTDAEGKRLYTDAEAAAHAEGTAWAIAVLTGPLQQVVAEGVASGGLRRAAVDAALERAEQATVRSAAKAFSQNQVAGLSNIFLQSLITNGSLRVMESQRTGAPVDGVGLLKESAKAMLDFAPTSALVGVASARGHILEALGRRHLAWEEEARQIVLADAVQTNPALKPDGSVSVKVDPDMMWEAGNVPGSAAATDVQLGPDTAVEVLQHLAQGEVVYVDKAAFDKAAKDRSVKPEDLAAAIFGDGGAAYRAAEETRSTELPVPAGKFYGRVGGTEVFGALRDDIRLSQTSETRRQAQARRTREQANFEKMKTMRPEEMDPEARKVYDDYFEKGLATQDREAADANARVMAAVAKSWSDQMKEAGTADLTPWQVYQDNQVVNIFGPDGRTSEMVAKARQAPPAQHPGDQQHFVNTYEALKARPVAEGEAPAHAQLVYRDATTRLLGEAALTDLAPNPEKPNFAILTFGFKKDVNDALGHERADDGFRSIGRELHAEDPLAAKLGGDFVLPHFGTQDEANALAARLQAKFPGVPIIATVAPRVKGEKWSDTKHRLGDAIQAHANKLRGEGKYPTREEKLPATADLTKFTPERVTDHTLPKELVDRHARMSDEAARRAVYTEAETGALTKAGWDETRRSRAREFVLAMDARAIAAMDKTLGHAVTDGMIHLITTRALELGGADFDFAHVSGDEFKAHGADKVQLAAFLERLKVSLAAEKVYIEGDGGRVLEQDGLFIEGGIAGGPHAERDADAVELPAAKTRANQARGNGVEEAGKLWFAGRSRSHEPGTPEAERLRSAIHEDHRRLQRRAALVDVAEGAGGHRAGGRRGGAAPQPVDPKRFVGVLNDASHIQAAARALSDAGHSYVRVDNGDGTSDFVLHDDRTSLEARVREAIIPSKADITAVSDKGVPVADTGVVKAGELVELKQTRNLAEWFTEFSKNKKVKEVYSERELGQFRAALDISRMIFKRNESLLPAENEGNSPLQSNADFGYSLDFTTICPRQDAYVAHVVAVERAVGRLLKPEERYLIGKMMEEQKAQPNCWYCYGSAGRNRYDTTVGSARDVMQRFVEVQRVTDGKASAKQLDEVFVKEGEYKFTPRGSKLRKFLDENWARIAKEGLPDEVSLRDLARGFRAAGSTLEGDLASAAHIFASNATHANDPKPWASIKQQLLRIGADKVLKLNNRAGLRMNSQTDFRPWQAIELSEALACARATGLRMHDYTKETAILQAFGKTGIKFNLSAAYELDAAGRVILDERGLPKFSSVDGMAGPDIEHWIKELPRDAGGMLVAVNDDALLAGLTDPRIHMIIPYHQGPIPKTVNEMAHARNYTRFQHEHGWGETRKVTGWGESRPVPKLDKAGKPVIDEESGEPVTMREYLRAGTWVKEGTPEKVVLDDGREFTVKVGQWLNPTKFEGGQGTVTAISAKLGVTWVRKPKTEVFRRGQWVAKAGEGVEVVPERITLKSGRVVEVETGASLNASHHKSNLEDYFDLCNQLGITPKFADLELTKADGTVVRVAERGADGKWDPAKVIPGYMKMVVDVAREPNDQAVPDPMKIDFQALYKIQEDWIAKGGENLEATSGATMPLAKVSPELVELLVGRVQRGEWPQTAADILPAEVAAAQESARMQDRVASFGPLEEGEREVPATGDLADLASGRVTIEAPAQHMLFQGGGNAYIQPRGGPELAAERDRLATTEFKARNDPAQRQEWEQARDAWLDDVESSGGNRRKAEESIRTRSAVGFGPEGAKWAKNYDVAWLPTRKDLTLTAADLIELRNTALEDPAQSEEYVSALTDVGVPRPVAEYALKRDLALADIGKVAEAGNAREASARAAETEPQYQLAGGKTPRWLPYFFQRADQAFDALVPVTKQLIEQQRKGDAVLFDAAKRIGFRFDYATHEPVDHFTENVATGEITLFAADGTSRIVNRNDILMDLEIVDEGGPAVVAAWKKATGMSQPLGLIAYTVATGNTSDPYVRSLFGMGAAESLTDKTRIVNAALQQVRLAKRSAAQGVMKDLGLTLPAINGTRLASSSHRDGGPGGTFALTDYDRMVWPELANAKSVSFATTADGKGMLRVGMDRGWAQDVEPIAGTHQLYQPRRRGDRGRISFAPARGGERRQFDIAVLEGGDRSTLAHETFHFLSEVFGDLVQSGKASPQMVADYNEMLKFMGYESHEARSADAAERLRLSVAIDRATQAGGKADRVDLARMNKLVAKEESITHAWEQYLSEGKAPDATLVRTFAKFQKWITAIYRSTVGGQATGMAGSPAEQFEQQFGRPLQVSDAVRQVFDRMLSADAAATKALGEPEHQPIPAVVQALPRGMQDDYLRQMEAAKAAATSVMVRRIAESERRENTRWAKAEKARLTEMVDAELDSHPAYRAAAALRDGAPMAENAKLDKKAVVEEYGLTVARTLARNHPGIYGDSEGRPDGELRAPNDMAQLLGFESGDEMIRQLAAAEPREKVATQEADRRFREAYGAAMKDDGERLAKAALDAVHDERHLNTVVMELHALAGLVDPNLGKGNPKLSLDEAKRVAERILQRKSVAEVRPDYFLQQERSAARKAFEAAEKGDLREAYAQKQLQIIHASLYRQARDLEGKLDSGLAHLQQTRSDRWRAYLGKSLGLDPVTGGPDTSLRDAHDAVLTAIGLAPDTQTAQLNGLDALAGLDALFEREFQTPDFDLDALREVVRARTAWDNLATTDALNVLDAVTHFRALARGATDVVVGEARRDLNKVATSIAEQLVKSQAAMRGSARDAALESTMKKVGDGLRHFEGMQLTADTWAQMIDGGPEGPFRDNVYRPWRDAVSREEKLNERYTKVMLDLIEQLPKDLRRRSTEEVDDIGDALPVPAKLLKRGMADGKVTRSYLWMIALNLGNGGNKQRLLDGYEWNEAQVHDYLGKKLTRPEWEFVQRVWDSLETLRPELEKVHEADTGLPLKLAKADPFAVRTADGEVVQMKGGYWPIVYSRFNERGEKNLALDAAKSVADIFDTRYVRGTDTGATKTHVDQFNGALNLDWSVAPRHVEQVVHDIAFRQFAKQTARILMHPDVDSALRTRLGEGRTSQILPWVQSVANRSADSLPANLAPVQRLMSWLKDRTASQVMGYVMSIPLGDLANPAAVVARGEVSAKHMALSSAKLLGSPEARDWCMQNSPELQHRHGKVRQRLADQFARVAGKKENEALRLVRRGAYVFQEMTDHLTSLPIWHAKYAQELERLTGEGDLQAHEHAVSLADDTLQRNFPPTDPTEGPPMMRRKDWLGSMLMFVGYVNRLANAHRVMVDRAQRIMRSPTEGAVSKTLDVAAIAGQMAAFALVTNVFSEWMTGRGREDDETYGRWLLRKWALGPVTTALPVIGPAVEAAVTGKKASVRQAPGISALEQSAKLAGRVMNVATGEGEVDAQMVWDLLDQVGFFAKIPGTRQLRRIGETVPNARMDSASNVARTVGGVVYGEKRQPSENPATLAAEVLKE